MKGYNISHFQFAIESISTVFNSIIIDNLVVYNGNICTWENYIGGLSRLFYITEFQQCFDKKQYTFLLNDGSFFQFFAKFDKDGVVHSRLAYYPYPVIKSSYYLEELDEFIYHEEGPVSDFFNDLYNALKFNIKVENVSQEKLLRLDQDGPEKKDYLALTDVQDELLRKKYPVTHFSHIRVDYDRHADTHEQCEFQFGGMSSIRMPIDRYIDPFLFFSLIVHWFFDLDKCIKNPRKYKSELAASCGRCILIPRFAPKYLFNSLAKMT